MDNGLYCSDNIEYHSKSDRKCVRNDATLFILEIENEKKTSKKVKVIHQEYLHNKETIDDGFKKYTEEKDRLYFFYQKDKKLYNSKFKIIKKEQINKYCTENNVLEMQNIFP